MPDTPEGFILRASILSFRADPRIDGPDAATVFESDGAVAVRAGKIAALGPAGDVIAENRTLPVLNRTGDLIMAGFVDTHVHYPQYAIIASYGEQLLEWLNRYTFPEELRFADPAYAAKIAGIFLDGCLRCGTTTASVYPTVHTASVDAFCAAANERGMCMAVGKVLMDRNAPDGLKDAAQTAYDESAALIARWHNNARLTYAITPRFAVTSTPQQLEAAGALWRAHPGTLLQSHISENHAEIALVRGLFPYCADYFAVYEHFGLAGPGANFGHAIHLSERERAALAETGTGVSHCPTSNLFLGSGLMDLAGLRARGIPVGLATDVGGGTSLSSFATMRAAYEVARLSGDTLHPADAFYLATLGGARLLRLDDRIGNLEPGKDADLVVLDLASTPHLAHRNARADDHWDALFAQMIMADDRAVRETYVAGVKLYDRDRTAQKPDR